MAPAVRLPLLTRSAAQTRALGRALAPLLAPGDVLHLVGDLGAGKTQLAKGIAGGLGIDPAQVTSPTFTLVAEHPGRLVLYHVDLYRLETADALDEIGFHELPGADGIAVVEWADRFAAAIAPPTARLTLGTGGGDTERIVLLEWIDAPPPGLRRILEPWHKS